MPVVRKPKQSNAISYNTRNFADQVALDCPDIYYRFNEKTGSIAIDRSGFNRNGSYSTVTFLTNDLANNKDSSVKSLNATYNNTFNDRSEMSAEVLVSIPYLPIQGMFFTIGGSTGFGLGLGNGDFVNNGYSLVGVANNISWLNTGFYVTTGTHHFAITVDSQSYFRIYADGKLVSTSYCYYQVPDGNAYLGGYPGGYGANDALIYDEFAFYNSCLPGSRIRSHWNAAKLGVA